MPFNKESSLPNALSFQRQAGRKHIMAAPADITLSLGAAEDIADVLRPEKKALRFALEMEWMVLFRFNR